MGFTCGRLPDWAGELPPDPRFTPIDSGAAVDVAADFSRVPTGSDMAALMGRRTKGLLGTAGQQGFGALRQRRAARLVLDHADGDAVFPTA